MADDTPCVDSELESHKTDLNGWIESISSLTISNNRKNVAERFVRDCRTLINDVDKEETPSAEDLNDFVDRKNSLEIQYTQITESNDQ